MFVKPFEISSRFTLTGHMLQCHEYNLRLVRIPKLNNFPEISKISLFFHACC